MQCPRLHELPAPPAGKTGWPWTIETPRLPERRPDGSSWPRISIVTPTYNHGQFIEETIRSVLLQGYPDLEYIIVDGASDDGSVETIKKYEKWLTFWVSEKDRGQSHAINKGFEHTKGAILNWLNSDDALQPHALWCVGSIQGEVPDADLISGGRLQKSIEGFAFNAQVTWTTDWRRYEMGFADFPQEATFFSRRLWDRIGSVDEHMLYNFDVLFFSKAVRSAQAIAVTHFPISSMLVHREMKTLKADLIKQHELDLVRKYAVGNSLLRRMLERMGRSRLHILCPMILAVLAPRARQVRAVDYCVLSGTWQEVGPR